MPNVFKYNPSSTEAKSLRKGNFYIGVGDVGKGPTNETGFWNGLTVGTFSYVIVLHRGENVPTFYQIQNDTELIERTNQIDKSVVRTTKEQCFSYFSGQSDKMLINKEYSSIITDGLVLNLDMSYLSSFPATGSTWSDLSSNQNNGTLVNSPVFSSGGWIQFDGQDDQVNIPNNSSLQITGDQTLEFIVYPERRDRRQNWYDKAYGGEGTITYEVSGDLNYYWGTAGGNNQPYQGVGTSGSPLSTLNRWYHVVLVRELSTATKTVKWYINGSLNATVSASYTAAVASTTQIRLGVGYTNFFLGRMAITRQYNIALSQSQVLQNYYQGPIVSSGLIHYWDSANLVSYPAGGTTSYSLAGTVTGSLQNGVVFSSQYGGFWTFDGSDDRILLSSSINMGNGSTPWTISAWVRTTTNVTGLGQGTIISNQSGGPVYSQLCINSGKICYWVYKTSWVQYLGNTTINTGTWVNLVWRNNVANTMTFFVNGVFDGTVSDSSIGGPTTNPLDSIGRYVGQNSFAGDISMMMIYNSSLSQAEISQNFNAHRSRFGI